MRTFLAAVVVIAGCGGGGGGKGPTAPSNTATGTPVAVGDPWAAVVKGATFTVDNKLEGEADVQTIVATITEVEGGADRRVIHIAWTSDGKPLDASSLPDTVTVSADTVAFSGLEFPRATKAELADGRYVMVDDDGTVCYGTGPEPTNDTPCEDVCFAHLCVHATHGMVGGAGTWWPNYVVFERPDLRK
jgi:hypothetical protein